MHHDPRCINALFGVRVSPPHPDYSGVPKPSSPLLRGAGGMGTGLGSFWVVTSLYSTRKGVVVRFGMIHSVNITQPFSWK